MATVDVYRALWRHRFLIIGLTALIGGVAWYVTSRQPRIYEASALVRVQQKITTIGDAFGSLQAGTQLAQTYARIATTDTVKNDVAATLPRPIPLSEINISASPVVGLELLQISARSKSPQTAALVANAATQALQTFISTTGTLRDQMVVVDKASVPTTSVLPRVKLTVALAVLLGLLLNCGLALLIEFFADPLPDQGEMEDAFGRPVLATVPPLPFPKTSTLIAPGAPQRGGGLVQPSTIGSEGARKSGA